MNSELRTLAKGSKKVKDRDCKAEAYTNHIERINPTRAKGSNWGVVENKSDSSGRCGLVGWTSSRKEKGHWSMVRPHAAVVGRSLVGVHVRGSHRCFPHTLMFLSLSFGREGERAGERHQCASDTHCLSHAPNWGPGPQPRHVP